MAAMARLDGRFLPSRWLMPPTRAYDATSSFVSLVTISTAVKLPRRHKDTKILCLRAVVVQIVSPPCRKRCRGIAAAWEVSAKAIYIGNFSGPARTRDCRPQRVTRLHRRFRQWQPNRCECPTGLEA